MVEKIRNPDYPASLSDGGWFLPTDYVLMKPTFRKDLLRLYTKGLEPRAQVLDLNAGTHGLGPDLIAAGLGYRALEQNRLVREALTGQGLDNIDWRPPTIPADNDSVDLIVSLAFFEHLPTWIAAFEQLLEFRRALATGGRVLIVAPNAPGNGPMFWDDYKHGWYVSRKRLHDMAADAGLEVVSTRYSIGWITLMQGPIGILARFIARTTVRLLNLPPILRLVEAIRLDGLAAKVSKTIFELVAVELRKPDGRTGKA